MSASSAFPSSRLVAVGFVVHVLGCGGPAPGDAAPGIYPGSPGATEVVVIDLDDRTALAAAQVSANGEAPRSVDAAGVATFADGDDFTFDVSAPGYRAVRFVGVDGNRVVIPLVRDVALAPLTVSVTGLLAGEVARVSVASRPALFQASSVRLSDTDGAQVAPCEPEASGCVATVRPESTNGLVVVAVMDGAGEATRIVRFEGVVTGAVLDLADGTELPFQTLEAVAPMPGDGLTEVVGVPGVSFGSTMSVLGLPYRGNAVRMAVPDVAGNVANRWALFVAQGLTPAMAPDPAARSVLVERSVGSAIGTWDGWLTPPDVARVGGVLTLVPTPLASLHCLDWLDAAGRVLRSDFVLDPGAALEPPTGAATLRLRAIDAALSPADAPFDARERSTRRFAERDVDLGAR